MDAEEIKQRTKKFTINIIRLSLQLPDNSNNRIFKSQIVRSGSSVGSNYKAARRAKSKPDFINKLKIVEEELDESLFFLEVIEEFNPALKIEVDELYLEGETLLKIIVSTIKTSRL